MVYIVVEYLSHRQYYLFEISLRSFLHGTTIGKDEFKVPVIICLFNASATLLLRIWYTVLYFIKSTEIVFEFLILLRKFIYTYIYT